MCEPDLLRRTGLTVGRHQALTTRNYLELRSLAPDLPIVPVLQGWTLDDYLRHREQFAAAGVDLAALPLVGVGSVCRRQGSGGVRAILSALASSGLRLHAFGLKAGGLRLAADRVVSADSLAWSLAARYRPALPECAGLHRRCNNCLRYALDWRGRLLAGLDFEASGRAGQRRLF